jgi:hypothetical protein
VNARSHSKRPRMFKSNLNAMASGTSGLTLCLKPLPTEERIVQVADGVSFAKVCEESLRPAMAVLPILRAIASQTPSTCTQKFQIINVPILTVTLSKLLSRWAGLLAAGLVWSKGKKFSCQARPQKWEVRLSRGGRVGEGGESRQLG